LLPIWCAASSRCRLIRRAKNQGGSIYGSYIEDILRNVHPVTRRAGIHVELDLVNDLEIELQTGALAQVLTNLVQNAAMHAFEGISEPQLTITCALVGGRVVIPLPR